MQRLPVARNRRNEIEDILQHAPLFQLEVNQEVLDLADRYMSEGLFPSKYLDDAIHVALATAYGCDVWYHGTLSIWLN